MTARTLPNISHLTANDIALVIKESASSDIEKHRATVGLFFDRLDVITAMKPADVEKIALLLKSMVAEGVGGCSGCSGGCC